jgi:phosphatidylserine/phosphatidylglycerophosphate/cardiolipin synthase-like enzyme
MTMPAWTGHGPNRGKAKPQEPMQEELALLRPGRTCWRLAEARNAAMLADASAYMKAMVAAIRAARRSILLLGWDFDPRIQVEPGGRAGERLCDLLEELVRDRPGLEVRILIWDMVWAYAVQRRDRPQTAPRWLPARVGYRIDGEHPPGAAHHQKILVVDDAVAFCGGADFTRNRWDTPAHLPHDPRRRTMDGRIYDPRHDVVLAVDGEAAATLGELARERWRRATGEALAPPPARPAGWPPGLVPDFTDVRIGIVRTEPAWRGLPEVRETEALYLAAIAAARRWIYLENQYVTAPVIRDALAARLAEADGPEVIIVCPAHSGAVFDRLTMDHARNAFIHHLRRMDRYGRFRAFAAMADRKVPITIHSKVMAVDDRLLRVGSANLNNRSFGLDTECDLAIEAMPGNRATRAAVTRCLVRLLAEHLGSTSTAFTAALAQTGSLRATIELLNDPVGHHLQPFADAPLGLLDGVIGRLHPLDPRGVTDNWRPWRRWPGAGTAPA